MKTLGIIDIGSNSIKLIIVEIDNNSYKEIFHKKFQTRLSDFIDNENKNLSAEGMKNFFGIIFTFKKYHSSRYKITKCVPNKEWSCKTR